MKTCSTHARSTYAYTLTQHAHTHLDHTQVEAGEKEALEAAEKKEERARAKMAELERTNQVWSIERIGVEQQADTASVADLRKQLSFHATRVYGQNQPKGITFWGKGGTKATEEEKTALRVEMYAKLLDLASQRDVSDQQTKKEAAMAKEMEHVHVALPQRMKDRLREKESEKMRANKNAMPSGAPCFNAPYWDYKWFLTRSGSTFCLPRLKCKKCSEVIEEDKEDNLFCEGNRVGEGVRISQIQQ